MWQQLVPGLRMMLFLTLVTGVVYPLATTALCQALFQRQANGSVIESNGHVTGSELIGQTFTKPEYFHGRPSAVNYDATASGGSNLGPASRKLVERVRSAAEQFRKDNPDYHGPIPADLLTTSASGLDPHISPEAAEAQTARVAKARAVKADDVAQLVGQLIETPAAGLIGEARVNVLKLNLALDQRFPARSGGGK